MSRAAKSAKDATRFTATAPHVYSKPTPSIASQQPPNVSRPSNSIPGETAVQKVARLRAAHAMKRASEISMWDTIVVKGRWYADAAHRFTVMGLLGLTVVATGVTIFSLGDMIIYNRRKKEAYFREQTALRERNIIEARKAAATGTADEDQVLLLNQEQAKEIYLEAQKEKKGVLSPVTDFFSTKGLKEEDSSDLSKVGKARADDASAATRAPAGDVLRAVEEKRRTGEKELQARGIKGGSLDRTAEVAAEKAAQTGGGWTSWMNRKN